MTLTIGQGRVRDHQQAIENAREDFNAFVEFVGVDHEGNPMRQAPLHCLIWEFEQWCYDRGLWAGVMVPMGHGKTTQCELRAAWEIGRDTNTICAFAKSSEDMANRSAGAVRAIMKQERYALVFPEAVMARGKDGDTEFTLKRSGVSPWPTLGCYGVQTGVGIRCTFMILDDIVDLRNAIQMPAERKKVAIAFDSTWVSRPTRVGTKPPHVIWIQTSYHVADITNQTLHRPDSGWAWLIVRAEPPYEKLSYEIWVAAKRVSGGTVANFMSQDALLELSAKMNTIAAARGLANRPISADEQKFDESLFNGPPPQPLSKYTRRIAFVDPAGDAKKAKRGDPDWCAMVAGGRLRDGTWDVVRSERIRGTASRQAEFVAENVRDWDLHHLYVEAVADAAMPELIKAACTRLDIGIPISRIQPRVNKEVRIEEDLEPPLRKGKMRINREAHAGLVAELEIFPLGGHDDLADACAGMTAKAIHGGVMRHRSATSEGETAVPRPVGRYSWERGLFRPLG